jgi:hypothetical protein
MGFTLPFNHWFRTNIESFNVRQDLKQKFFLDELTWARFWSLHILEKFK